MKSGIDSDHTRDSYVEKLREVVAADPSLVNQECSDMSYPPMIVAVARGQLACLEVLMDARGADLDIQDSDGMTPLMWSCRNGSPSGARMLIERGASVDRQCKMGCTAVMWAARRDEPKCVEELIEAGAALDVKNKAGLSALDLSEGEGNVKCSRLLKTALSDSMMEAPWKKSFKLLG